MSFLAQNLDSSDEEDDSNLFRHSERTFNAIIAEQQRLKLQKAEVPTELAETTSTTPRKGKRKSDQHDSSVKSDVKRQKSVGRSVSPVDGVLPSVEHVLEGDAYESTNRDEVTPSIVEANGSQRSPDTDHVITLNDEEEELVGHVRGPTAEDPASDESDDEFAQVIRQARRAQQLKSRTHDSDSSVMRLHDSPVKAAASNTAITDPVVEIFLSSHLPSTRPLRVRVRLSQQLGIVRLAWCHKQGFSDETMKDIFLVYRLRKIYDMSTCRSLGFDVDASGQLIIKGREHIVDATTVLLHAATEEIFQQLKDGTLSEDVPPRQESIPPAVETSAPIATTSSEKVNLVLRANTRADFKITTKPGTSIGKIIKAYRKMNAIPADVGVSLTFDGDLLAEETFVRDTELSDMDIVEVRIG